MTNIICRRTGRNLLRDFQPVLRGVFFLTNSSSSGSFPRQLSFVWKAGGRLLKLGSDSEATSRRFANSLRFAANGLQRICFTRGHAVFVLTIALESLT